MDEFPLALQFPSLMRLVRPEHRAFKLIQRLTFSSYHSSNACARGGIKIRRERWYY
jgi:hypothetical protein